MNYIIQLLWVMIAYYQRLTVRLALAHFVMQNMPDIIDYHWLGGLTERSVMIKVIVSELCT
jgi:hypothetical protein